MLVHVFNHTVPNVKCEAEAGESLEAQQAGRPCLEHGRSQRLTPKVLL